MDHRFRGFVSLFQRLGDAVDKIDKTLKAIAEISELTNLLSLNATIEAAMAGASGDMSRISSGLQTQKQSIDHIAAAMAQLSQAVNLLTGSSEVIKGNLDRQKYSTVSVLKTGSSLKTAIQEMYKSIHELGGGSCDETLPIGHDVTYPPWVHISDGHSAGITVEVARQIPRLEGLHPEFRPSQFADALEDLFNGKIRILANAGWPMPSLMANRSFQAFHLQNSDQPYFPGTPEKPHSREWLT